MIVGSILPLIQGRLRPKILDAADRKFDTTVFWNTTFMAITFSNIFQGLGFFLTSSYLPCESFLALCLETFQLTITQLMPRTSVFQQHKAHLSCPS